MSDAKRLTLAQMRAGQTGTITELGAGRHMQQLQAMGIRPGKRITKISSVFRRGPVTLQIGNTQIAIGFGMAQKIIVEVDSQ